MSWNLNFNGGTKLKEFWGIVKENFSFLKTEVDSQSAILEPVKNAVEKRYRTGTWTPVFYDANRNVVNTFTVSQATFSCVCNICFFTCCFTPTSGTSIKFFSLPFAVKSGANNFGVGHAFDSLSKADLTMMASDQAAFDNATSAGCVSGWFMLEEYTETSS